MKAGDPAPPLSWTKILQPAGYSGPGPADFDGQVTLLLCVPEVSSSESIILQWNELAAKFANEPVQFVWLMSETNGWLPEWLDKHPVSGWLLFDWEMETARRFEVWIGSAVVGPDGRLAGFSRLLPDEFQLKEILAGRPAAIDPEPFRPVPRRRPQKPDVPPSLDVYISAGNTSGTYSTDALDYMFRRGFDLKTVMSEVYEIEPSRIVLPASLDIRKPYDFVLVPPDYTDQERMSALMRAGIEKYFGIVTAFENVPTEVYVMTVGETKTPVAKAKSGSGGFVGWGASTNLFAADAPRTIEALQSFFESPAAQLMWIESEWAESLSLTEFRLKLEEILNRPIVDETNLAGSYDLRVRGPIPTIEDAILAIRTELGLVLMPERREIRTLLVQFRQ